MAEAGRLLLLEQEFVGASSVDVGFFKTESIEDMGWLALIELFTIELFAIELFVGIVIVKLDVVLFI